MVDSVAATAVIVAVCVDLVFGDPPNRYHPVVAMGNFIGAMRRLANEKSEAIRFGIGILCLVIGSALFIAIGWGVERFSQELPFVLAVLLQALVLKTTFSIRSLASAGRSVAEALQIGDLGLARQRVAYHLVSRDVSQLDEAELSAAAIESVAENTSDSLIAPIFYYAIAGLPGALVYRFVNTNDAMLGYRTKELEWLGKPAARLDDLLNLIPARLTALIMLIVGRVDNESRRSAFAVWFRDHRLTASPNAGHPMSAAAGLLGVVLEKRDHYRLGAGLPQPTVRSIDAVIKLLYRTSLAGSMLVMLWCILRSVWFGGSHEATG
ncbi:MAG: cobalamin biosynthesis protein [Pirellula staleyi]